MKIFPLPLGKVVAVRRVNGPRKETIRFFMFLRSYSGRWKLDIEITAWYAAENAKKGELLVESARRLAVAAATYKLGAQV